MADQTPIERLNLFGPAFKAEAYAVYARLRAEAPVLRRANRNGPGATCFITRYEDAVAVLRDAKRFVKDVRNSMTPEQRVVFAPDPPLMRLLSHHMLNSDAPDHTRLRGLVNQAFTTRMVEQLHGRIETIAHDLLGTVAAQRSADLIAAYALPLPIIVIADLLGVPSRDYHRVRAWSNALVAPNADSARSAKKLAKAGALMEDFIAYLRAIFAARRAKPRDDLISSLLAAEEAGDVLSENELFSMILLLIVVGHETTVNLIGNGVLALLQHPEQLDRLRREPALISGAVEEMLRYDCPVERAPMRYASEDVLIGDTWVRRGDAVSVVLGSANRDPAQFPDADRFDLTRDPNRHLAFGLGPHYCLGAALARLEGRIAAAVLLERFPALRLADDVAAGVVGGKVALRWRTHPIMRGLQRLPVCW